MKIPLKDWRAWAPGIETATDWLQYTKGAKSLDLSQKPDVSFLPPMFRRKLTPLSKMIFASIYILEKKRGKLDCPVILATRHGELDISIDLINSEFSNQPFSPAKFSSSVHNSPVGFLSIHSKNTKPNTAISAGSRTLEMALYESMALLNRYEQCLLIYADNTLSEVYRQYNDETSIPICVTALLDKTQPGQKIHFPKQLFQPIQLIKQLCQISPSEVNKKA